MPISSQDAKRPKHKLNFLANFLRKRSRLCWDIWQTMFSAKQQTKTHHFSHVVGGMMHFQSTLTMSSRRVTEQLQQWNRESDCQELKWKRGRQDRGWNTTNSNHHFPTFFFNCLEICEMWQIKKWLRMSSALRSVSANMCISRNQSWN